MQNTDKFVKANEPINSEKLEVAQRIITGLQRELPSFITKGSGPFLAAVYDPKGNLIAKEANSVMQHKCSHNHAEMNAIKSAEQKLGTHDLSSYNLKLYVTAEPCMMCLGGIMWSGIKEVYYGVPSRTVEKITGFDEGFKPRWFSEFQKRGITVYGNIAVSEGVKVLKDYVGQGHIVYKPERN